MKYMGDEDFWDTLFERRGEKRLSPEAALIKNLNLLNKGSILDLACGDGRNALYLLENNFHVTGVDFSQSGLDRLKHFAADFGDQLGLEQINLSEDNCLAPLGRFDNILICHYRVTAQNLKTLSSHLNEKGILLLTGFGDQHVCDARISEDDLIHQGDVDILLESFELISEEHVSDERGYFVTFVFRKKD